MEKKIVENLITKGMQKTINKLKTLAQIESDCLLRLGLSSSCLSFTEVPKENNIIILQFFFFFTVTFI